MDIKLLKGDLGSKDYSVVQDGDVVILPAFGATIQEMQFLDAKWVNCLAKYDDKQHWIEQHCIHDYIEQRHFKYCKAFQDES